MIHLRTLVSNFSIGVVKAAFDMSKGPVLENLENLAIFSFFEGFEQKHSDSAVKTAL